MIDEGGLERLKQHIWNLCKKENIFIDLAENVNSSCVSIPCRDFENRVHYNPIKVILNKSNKKLTNVIFLSHEAGHFLDIKDNPKGWDEEADHLEQVFEAAGGNFVRHVSSERYEREKEAWKRGYRILDASPDFSEPIRKKFEHWKKSSMDSYTKGYENSCELLKQGKKPIPMSEAQKILEERAKKAKEEEAAKKVKEEEKEETVKKAKRKKQVEMVSSLNNLENTGDNYGKD